MKTNKEIIDLSSAYNGIKYQYDFEKRINNLISRLKQKEIIKIEVNNVEILPCLEQLKILLLSMSKNQLTKSKIFIESKITKNDTETLNLLSQIFNRAELKV